MSDVTAPAATDAAVASEAPAPAPEQVAAPVVTPEPQPARPEGARSKHDLKRDIRTMVEERLAAPAATASADAPAVQDAAPPAAKVDAQGKLHGEGGKYVSGATPTEEVTKSTPAPPASAGPVIPEGFVRIELREDHPWRREGDSLVVPAAQEKLVRTAINEATRRKSVEDAQARATSLAEQNARLQARLDAMQSGVAPDPLSDPKVRALYEAIKADPEWGEEQAANYLAGLNAKREVALGAKEQEAVTAVGLRQTAQTVLSSINAEASAKYGIWAGGELQHQLAPRLADYGDIVDARLAHGGEGPSAEEFFQFVDFGYTALDQRRVPGYAHDPRVARLINERKSQQEAAKRLQIEQDTERRVRAQLEADEKARLADAATRHRNAQGPNRLQHARTGARAVEPPTQQDVSKLPISDRKKALREEVRRMAGGA